MIDKESAARCFLREDEERFARGWPHVVELVDGHKDDKKPAAMVPKLYAKYYGAYHVRWPRRVAQRFVRAMGATAGTSVDGASAIEAAAQDGPLSSDEALSLLGAIVSRRRRCQTFRDEHFVFCLEALAGTDTLLVGLTELLEGLPGDRLGVASADSFEDGVIGFLAYLTGYLLLRASPDAGADARPKLEAVWHRSVDAGVAVVEESLRGGLDLALHGVEGAHRVLPTSHWQYLCWWGFVDDVPTLRERLAARAKSDWNPDVRHIYLTGGELFPDLTAPRILRGLGPQRPAFLADLGMLALPGVVDVMVDALSDKSAKELPKRWLATHRDFARPRVEERARAGDPRGIEAKEILSTR